MNILLWHVHGSWTTAFVQGQHQYYLPVVPDRGAAGRGRAQTWDWPPSAVEVTPEQIKHLKLDAIIFQRPEEYLDLRRRWFDGKQNVRTFYVEHNCPQGRINEMRHPAADDPNVTVVHVTHFNDLFWDCGAARTAVIEHGVLDPGYRYTGEITHGAIVVNEPLRRARVTGTDLIPRFAEIAPVDLFGMKIAGLLVRAFRCTRTCRRRRCMKSCRGGASTSIRSGGRRSVSR